jgi:hypothetical protein
MTQCESKVSRRTWKHAAVSVTGGGPYTWLHVLPSASVPEKRVAFPGTSSQVPPCSVGSRQPLLTVHAEHTFVAGDVDLSCVWRHAAVVLPGAQAD